MLLRELDHWIDMTNLPYASRRSIGRLRAEVARRRRSVAAQLEVPNGLGRERLVPSPVFVLSCERSGSTLLRAILDSHSQICAPHELHLRLVEVQMPSLTRKAMSTVGLTENDLENMLWDQVLRAQLAASGKAVVVDKTPHNVRAWRRINSWWPEARYVFLFRHPQRIYDSLVAARPDIPRAEHVARVVHNVTELSRAARSLNGLPASYERLTHHPEEVSSELCGYLGVPWEPAMVNYKAQPRSYQRGLGDWSARLASGRVDPERPLPAVDDVDPALRKVATLAGYDDRRA